jgi:hypothetical protein
MLPDPVRPEYRMLAERFPELGAVFGCAIPANVSRELVDFTLALECIDRELDARDSLHRSELGDAVLAGTVVDPPELARHVARLHELAPPALWAAARRALANSERMRATHSIRDYIACIEEEGRLTVEMLLAIVGPWCSPELQRFLHRVAELANLVDKLVDARADFRRGELAIAPGLALHAHLVAALLARVPGALAAHPSWPRFAAWGLSFVRVMVVR